MGDFRRRAQSPRQQGQFGSKVMNVMTTRRGREDWDAGRRDNAVARSVPSVRRGRTGWDSGAGRTKSPAAKDRQQDGAESDDDIAAKPRSHQPAQPSLGSVAGPARPALAQPGSHIGNSSTFFKSGAGAPPPDLVRKGYDSEVDIPAPPPGPQAKPSGFDIYSVRHNAQENISSRLGGATAPPRTRAPALDTQLSPSVQSLPQHRPATPPAPPPANAAPTKDQPPDFMRDSPSGTALEMPLSVSSLSDKINTVQSSVAAYSKDVEALQTTTSTHSSLISALQKRIASVVQQAEGTGEKLMQLEAAHGERLSAVEAARVTMEVSYHHVFVVSPHQ